ncbi:MAG: MarR family winged helix-turn-helix transcriptional regulator [Alphaproteobacteria bacterium]
MVEAGNSTSDKLTDLLDRLGRMTRCLQFAHGLNPAQWESLRFIARANCFSRTPSALATFLGTTKGTASQTLIALEKKGCMRRTRDGTDRRVTRLEITQAGEALLARDPLRCVDNAAGNLPVELNSALREALGLLADHLECANGWCKLGACGTCGNMIRQAEDGSVRCGLKDAVVPQEETGRLCVSYASQSETDSA